VPVYRVVVASRDQFGPGHETFIVTARDRAEALWRMRYQRILRIEVVRQARLGEAFAGFAGSAPRSVLVQRLAEALDAGITLSAYMVTVGPYSPAVPDPKRRFVFFESGFGQTFFPTAEAAATEAVRRFGSHEMIQALKTAAGWEGHDYRNLRTPIPWRG
jgi:hypothetical protein